MRYERLTEAVAEALRQNPASLRKLAQAASVPHVTLVKIGKGTVGASPHVARAVAEVLEEWSGELANASALIREALSEIPDQEGG
jgi:hypothetical protein